MNKLFSRLSQLKLCSAFSDEETGEQQQQQRANNSTALTGVSQNPFLDAPESATAVEYKKGYVMRKCCYDTSFKKSAFPIISQSKKIKIDLISFIAPFGKRSWKMFFITLRDLVLYLHKDEHGFRKSQVSWTVGVVSFIST